MAYTERRTIDGPDHDVDVTQVGPTPASTVLTSSHDVRDHDRDRNLRHRAARPGQWTDRETEPFYKTSEFLFTVAGVAALLVAGYAKADDSLDIFRTWMLVTILTSAYVVSRGLAKAGSSDPYFDDRD